MPKPPPEYLAYARIARHGLEITFVESPFSAWESFYVIVGSGAAGLTGLQFRRARKHMSYQPVLEDWMWHVVLPAIAYLFLLVASARLPRHDLPPQFVVAGASLTLLFIGIHNAWDTVRFIVTGADQSSSKPSTDK